MTVQVDWYMFPTTQSPFLSRFGVSVRPRPCSQSVAGPSSTSRHCLGCGAGPGAGSGAGAEGAGAEGAGAGGVAFAAFFFLDFAGRRRSRLMLFACAATLALAGTRPNAFAIA